MVGTSFEGELNDYFVIADTSQIRVRPNKATEAIELYEKGLLSGDSTLREAGFKPEQGMSEEEHQQWLLMSIARGAISPEIAAAALVLLEWTRVDVLWVIAGGAAAGLALGMA
jgi:hypothetical protein